ncbi:unnamed protein product, partial [Vitis vinifera]|uniref:Uncharacterized protein n=1 Tax=Vitis vinifera TaxID=29760 RepID=D7U422_VITVI
MIRYNRGWARRGGFQGFSVVDSYKNNGGLGTLTKALREPSSMPNMDCVFDCCRTLLKRSKNESISASTETGIVARILVNCYNYLHFPCCSKAL